MPAKTVSIIGLGWLGLPLAERLLLEGYQVKGSATSAEKVAVLRHKGIETHQLQLNPEPVGNLEALMQTDALVINVPPKAGKFGDDFHPEQIGYLANAIRQSSVKHIIYISSTSVYPELNREVVEDDVVEPHQSAATGLVRVEQLMQRLANADALQPIATSLRCGGLMGYDRIPGKYVAGRTVDSGAVPVNYLHRDDAVGILVMLIQNPISGTFNAVAPEHPTREAIYRKSCADFGYELPTFSSPVEPVSYKVVSPEKLLRSIDYRFQYPDPLQFFYQL